MFYVPNIMILHVVQIHTRYIIKALDTTLKLLNGQKNNFIPCTWHLSSIEYCSDSAINVLNF